MKKFKQALAILLCAVMVFSLAACNSSSTGSDTSTDTSTDTSGADSSAGSDTSTDESVYRVFKFGGDANSTTFNPYDDLTGVSSEVMKRCVTEPLLDVAEDGTATTRLASYAYNDDYTTFTLTAQEGITFSNGNAFTSEDILYDIQLMASSNRTSDMVASLDWENATIVDDYTVEFPVVSYDAALVSYLGNASFGAVDKETHEADSDWAWIVGTGPYVLSEWEESVRYVLTRNENYRGEAPLYDEIDIYFFTEESTRYAEFQSGNLDAIRLSEASYVNSLKSGTVSFASILTVEDSAVNGFSLASGEGTTGAFADINLRKALAHCLDINSIVESLGEGVYTVPDSLVSEDCWAYLAGTGAYEYDEAAAIEYLAAAGYSVDNPVTIAVYAESTAWNSAILEAAQSYAAKIGINLDLTGVADFSTILPALIAGENDMSISSPSSATSMDPAALLQQAGPNSDNSCLRVNDPELGQLYLDAASSHDQAERLELYKEFMQGYHDQYLFIPVYMAAYSYGYNSEHASFADAIDNSSYPDLTKVVD